MGAEQRPQAASVRSNHVEPISTQAAFEAMRQTYESDLRSVGGPGRRLEDLRQRPLAFATACQPKRLGAAAVDGFKHVPSFEDIPFDYRQPRALRHRSAGRAGSAGRKCDHHPQDQAPPHHQGYSDVPRWGRAPRQRIGAAIG